MTEIHGRRWYIAVEIESGHCTGLSLTQWPEYGATVPDVSFAARSEALAWRDAHADEWMA